MDSSVIVILTLTAIAVVCLVWLEIHSRAKRRAQDGPEQEAADAGITRPAGTSE